MNYRHDFHAGNAGDVLKHLVLLLVLDHLRQKPKPFVVIDTHAGAGAYALDGPEASRTDEWRTGIGRLLEDQTAPPALQRYLDQVRATPTPASAPASPTAPSGQGTWYPGSPLLIRNALRPGDRMVAIEAHPDIHATLTKCLGLKSSGHPKGITTRCGDGYQALDALLPPLERRGLILIDPPFESRTEFSDMALALRHAYRRFATGQYLLWYPIKDPGWVASFHQSLIGFDIPKLLCVELTTRALTTVSGMAGAGLIAVNPPWQMADTLRDVLPWLRDRLAQADGALWRVEWLRGEEAR